MKTKQKALNLSSRYLKQKSNISFVLTIYSLGAFAFVFIALAPAMGNYSQVGRALEQLNNLLAPFSIHIIDDAWILGAGVCAFYILIAVSLGLAWKPMRVHKRFAAHHARLNTYGAGEYTIVSLDDQWFDFTNLTTAEKQLAEVSLVNRQPTYSIMAGKFHQTLHAEYELDTPKAIDNLGIWVQDGDRILAGLPCHFKLRYRIALLLPPVGLCVMVVFVAVLART